VRLARCGPPDAYDIWARSISCGEARASFKGLLGFASPTGPDREEIVQHGGGWACWVQEDKEGSDFMIVTSASGTISSFFSASIRDG
jgi:hypothetical protein